MHGMGLSGDLIPKNKFISAGVTSEGRIRHTAISVLEIAAEVPLALYAHFWPVGICKTGPVPCILSFLRSGRKGGHNETEDQI